MARARTAPMNTAKLPTRQQYKVLPRQIRQVGRNEPCPCGSGKKYKACHERDGEAYLQKLAEDEAKKNAPPRPWYLRLLGL